MTLEKIVKNERGQKVRLAPCDDPYHVKKFEQGFIVVSCKKCVMEIVKRPSSSKENDDA